MGLFLDSNGIPLASNITPGNTDEQTTLKPIEERILKDFEVSKLIVCTDAGLSFRANQRFNSHSNKAYITVQSLKQLKGHLKEWALSSEGWYCSTTNNEVNLNDIIMDGNENTYYKERWISEDKMEERLIISFSPKYMHYQAKIRSKQ